MEIVPNIRFTTSFSGSRVPQAFSWRAYMAFRELWACPCPPSLSAAEVFRVLRHVRRRILKWFRKYSKYMELHVCSIPKEKIHPYELTITVIRARTQPIRRDSTNRTKTHLVIDPQILNILKFKFFNFFSVGNNLFEYDSKPWVPIAIIAHLSLKNEFNPCGEKTCQKHKIGFWCIVILITFCSTWIGLVLWAQTSYDSDRYLKKTRTTFSFQNY